MVSATPVRHTGRLRCVRTIIGSQIAQFASISAAPTADCVELNAARSGFGRRPFTHVAQRATAWRTAAFPCDAG
ncbi:hypothetical protein C7S13_4591 [Burkholderia cepacia]|nr:hypothetical protein [Burkholderia cepacia]